MDWSSLQPKIFSCFSAGYSFESFRKDVTSGLTVAVVSLPLAMALAIASNTSPIRGIYTAIVAGFLISLLGGSRYQIGGPTGAFVVVIFGVIERFGYDGLVLTTIMAGIMLVLAGVCRFGGVIRYIPYPVVTGFTAGLAVVLFTGQIWHLFGLDMMSLPGGFIAQWKAYFSIWPTVQPVTACLGVSTLIIILLLQKFEVPIPSFFLAIVIGGFCVWYFDLSVTTIGSKFGPIVPQLSVPDWPEISWARLGELLPSAFTIAFLAGVESLLSAMIADGMTGRRHHSDAELIAQGIANIASVSLGGIPATGAVARTITNIRSGAQTPLSGMMHAVFLLIFVIFLGSLVVFIPLASLAAVMSVIAWNMSEVRHFRYLMSAPRSDRAVLFITFFLTIIVDLTVAVQVGIVLAALLFMKRMNDVTEISGMSMPVSSGNGGEVPPMPEGVQAFQITGPFFFSVANRLKDELAKIRSLPKVFILRLRHVPAMDATAAHTLSTFIMRCHHRGTQVILAAVQRQPMQVVKQMKIDEIVGRENFVASTEEAIKRAEEILQKDATV